MAETVRVNFQSPMPVFPLAETVLLPHETLPLRIFEPRYVQMVSRCLDGPGQLAIATIDAPGLEQQAIDGVLGEAPVPLRPVVCVGQILQHETLADGRYNILLHGVCRARIRSMIEPEPEGDRLHRLARLRAIEQARPSSSDLERARRHLRQRLGHAPLDHLEAIDSLRSWARSEEISTEALVEIVGLIVLRDADRKYRLLAEPDLAARFGLVDRELAGLERLVRQASGQGWRDWPKGCAWN